MPRILIDGNGSFMKSSSRCKVYDDSVGDWDTLHTKRHTLTRLYSCTTSLHHE